MKKKLSYILIGLLSFFGIINNIYALSDDELISNEAILYNYDTNEVIYHKNTNEAVPIASLTKLMTYYVIEKYISDPDNESVTVTQEMLDSLKEPAASLAGIKVGSTYTVTDLLYGLMLPSGCDAAYVLAYYASNGNIDQFVNLMNDEANNLGMNNSIFADPSGLGDYADPDNIVHTYSTEEDLFLLVKELFKSARFKKIIATEFYYLDNSTTPIVNTVYMNDSYGGHGYYYKYSLGGKTGNLKAAGRCLIQFASNGENTLVAITLGVPNNSVGYYNMYDHEKMFNYGFQSLEEIKIDIEKEIASVDIGKKIKLKYITNSNGKISFESSNPHVLTVDSNGVVTGINYGTAVVKAITENGNYDSILISVGFYNGTLVSSRYSDHTVYNTNLALNWNSISNIGFDYFYVRAGWGSNSMDANYLANIGGVKAINSNLGIYFTSYAKTIDDAEIEANYVVDTLLPYVNDYEKFNLPILYDLTDNTSGLADSYFDILNAFYQVLKDKGYEANVMFTKKQLTNQLIEDLNDNSINTMIVYKPYETNLDFRYEINNYKIGMWLYRSDGGYDFLYNSRTNGAEENIMYMDSYKLNTFYDEYVEPVIEPNEEIPENEIVIEKGKDDLNVEIVSTENKTGTANVKVDKKKVTATEKKIDKQEKNEDEIQIIEDEIKLIEDEEVFDKDSDISNYASKNNNDDNSNQVSKDNKFMFIIIPISLVIFGLLYIIKAKKV